LLGLRARIRIVGLHVHVSGKQITHSADFSAHAGVVEKCNVRIAQARQALGKIFEDVEQSLSRGVLMGHDLEPNLVQGGSNQFRVAHGIL